MNKIDQLFRDKLGSHSLPAPPAAWDAIDEERPGARSRTWRWSAAASLLMALTLTYYLYTSRNGSTLPKEQIAESPASAPLTPLPSPSGKSEQVRNTPDKIHKADKKTAVTVPVEATPEAIPASEIMDAEVIISETVITKPQYPGDKPRGMVIRYALKPVGELPVVTHNAGAPAFEKALDAAREFKESDPYGRLRQAKDEIFAFNFLNTKKNNANEKHQ